MKTQRVPARTPSQFRIRLVRSQGTLTIILQKIAVAKNHIITSEVTVTLGATLPRNLPPPISLVSLLGVPAAAGLGMTIPLTCHD